jgi:hypothetical protein
MLKGLKFDDLARTFQDAVVITRHLGIRYLWIDTLCIMQDSKEDWAAEGCRMGKIYENSACTIAAAAVNNPHDGCFSSRNPLEIFDCQIAGSQMGADGM